MNNKILVFKVKVKDRPHRESDSGLRRYGERVAVCSRVMQESPDNDIILSQVLADRIQAARRERWPSAEELCK